MADTPKDPFENGSTGRDAGDYTSQLPRPVDPWATRAGDRPADGDDPTMADPAGPGTTRPDQTSGHRTPSGQGQPTAPMPPGDHGGPVGSTGSAGPVGPVGPVGPDREPAWSGRAGVPVRPAAADEPAPPEWPGPGGGPGARPWWTPILIGVLVLVLVVLLGLLVWWLNGLGDDATEPENPPTVAPTATLAPTQEATEAETDAPEPTPEQTTAAPVVAVPDLIGLTERQARAELDALGLVYRLELRDSDQPPGTVIDTDPSADSEVPPGSEVLLVISAADSEPSPEPEPTDPQPSAEPTESDED
ncbi:PASTA domain-containing protein [Solwaraspora sp. WMMD406]|uniref:PASTA domain-containing protein n=1 Tax=Solwaraspora sp. WMMD406 TaxID=3016095 RepID=UPI0024172013|nr:PASTA domain-containing protein [Solwaraspora sp. WMMD406]MDG4762987.1 PASTA domain-containing protein [Solwaraspora sp. WMMD406]